MRGRSWMEELKTLGGCTMCLLKEVNGSGGSWGEDFQKVIFPMIF
jgi:hypothetical protein